jgi:cupin fold WbuC family metalloprotein
MKIIDVELLDSVSERAVNSPRLRMNYNFHTSLDAKAQRLLNALEPGTELPIHRHLHTAETYILLRGSIRVLFFNDACEVTEDVLLNPLEGKFGIDIPVGQWHTLEVLESGSVIFEVKDGPYLPIGAEDMMVFPG